MRKERIIIKMAKNNKNAIKTAKKQTKTVEEKVKTQAAEAAVEAPKAEETKVEEPTPAPVEEKKEEIASPNGEVINPEVVEEAKVEKSKPATQVVNTSKATSLGAALSSAGGSTDRIDKNHAIDLAKMVYQEYVNNPDTPSSIRQTAKKQFDVMTGVALLQYFTQLEEDFENLGVRIKPHMREQAENVLTNYLGVKVNTIAQDDGQLLLQFEEIPTETRKTAAQDNKAKEKPIPEPSPELPEKEKLEALRTIFAQTNKGGIGGNLLSGIEWARKAFSFAAEEKKSVIFANILHKGTEATMINCLRGMVNGKMGAEHSILGAHALLKAWCPTLSEQEVAELTAVLMSAASKKKVDDWNEKGGSSHGKPTYDGELTVVNRQILAANAGNVIDAILKGNIEDVAVKVPDSQLDMIVHPNSIRKTLIAAYGDSENILKDKLKELVQYYAKPIMRLSSYVDKSAYAEAKK